MLAGEYKHTLDAKGRVFLPSKFRDDLEGKILIAKGLDKNLVIYSEAEWEKFVAKLEKYGDMKLKSIKRFILRGAFETEQDSQGRIVIPSLHREYAGIDKDITFVGLNNCVEIWNGELLDAKFAETSVDEMKQILLEVGF